MNNLKIQVYFLSHFPDYFNNMNCSLCIDQNRLKTHSFECFVLHMHVSVKYQWQLLKYHNMEFGFCEYPEFNRLVEDVKIFGGPNLAPHIG